MNEVSTYREFQLMGDKESVSFDGLAYSIFVYNTNEDLCFHERVEISGTAIVTKFSEGRNSTKALPYIRNLAISRAKGRIDLEYFKRGETYTHRILSSSQDDKSNSIKDEEVEQLVLKSLDTIRRNSPTTYRSELIDLDGIASVLSLDIKRLKYILTIMDECDLVTYSEGVLYVKNSGIQKLKTVTSINMPQAVEKIDHKWDVFISHASEDKTDVVEPLAAELKTYGINVWYDNWTLKLGDSLRKKIDEGLKDSKYGIVVLSPSFLKKDWTNKELAGLMQKEVAYSKENVILPVWHNITPREVFEYSPMISDKLGTNTNYGIPHVAKQIFEVIKGEILSQEISENKQYFVPNISYKYFANESSGDVHEYGLILSAELNSPPFLKGFKMSLIWPKEVKIKYQNGLIIKRDSTWINENQYIEFELTVTDPIYPGERVELVSPDLINQFSYLIDHKSWDAIRTKDLQVYYKVFFERAMPIEGSKHLSEINCF
jgi:hypothetical protein